MTVNAHPASQRGVDQQDLPWQLRVMQLGFRILRFVSRRAAGRLALHLFVTPRRHSPPARELAVLEQAEPFTVPHRGRQLAAWRWVARGESSRAPERRTALLVHGWEGRGGQLHGFVRPLLQAGFDVVAFDHVGHGESGGKRCSLPTMRDALRAVAEHSLEDHAAGPACIVAHSMGTFAASLVLAEGWRDTRVCYVAPPDDLLVYFSRYLKLVTGSDDLLEELIRLMEERFGERAEEFEFRRLVETLDQPLLVLHAKDDQDVPVEAGRFVAGHWPGARMLEFEGLGHRRILVDQGAIQAAAEFLAE